MNLKMASIIIAILGIAFLLVFQATRQSSMNVHLPSELAAAVAKQQNRIRVAGKVAANSIEYSVQPEIVLKFSIRNPDKAPHHEAAVDAELATRSTLTIPVVYRGIKPDMFADGRDVIIDGDFSGGVLQATKLLTQCPSKYEPAKPAVEN